MAVTTQTIEPSSLFAPYLQQAAQSLQNTTTQPYQPYTGTMVAGSSPLENQAYNTAANYQMPGQFQTAGNAYNSAIGGLMNSAQFQPTTFSGTYNPTGFSSGYSGPGSSYSGFTGYQAGPIGSSYQAGQTTGGVFDQGAAQQYMSPYQQSVTDIAKREADRDFQKQQAQLRARMGAAGAFGGSRATLLETENQRNQNQLLSDIQTKGLQDAFTNAQGMFGQDRAARLQAFGLNEGARQQEADMAMRGQASTEAARLSGSQLGLSALNAQEQARQQAGTMGLDAQRLAETSRQFGAGFGLDAYKANEANRLAAADFGQRGYATALQGAQGLASLGSQIDQSERARIAQMADLGLQQRGQQQAEADAQYKQYLDARDFGVNRAGAFAQGIGTLAGRFGSTTTNTPDPSGTAQTLGNLASVAGIAGSLFGKGGVFEGFF